RVVTTEPLAQTTQTIRVGRRGTNLDRHTLTVKQMKVETLATEIQTGVQHRNGPPFVSRGRAEHDSAAGPSSWHSLPCRETSRVSFLMCPFCVRALLTRPTTGPCGLGRGRRVRVRHGGR